MRWKLPPKVKIYEALGSIADGRVEVAGNEAKVYSSSRRKFYSVKYDGRNAIMANDNGSYWKEYLGYPSIALLMKLGVVTYDSKLAEALKDIKWKDVNSEFKNDFKKTEVYCLDLVKARGYEAKEIAAAVENIYNQIKKLDMSLLGQKIRPPEGY